MSRKNSKGTRKTRFTAGFTSDQRAVLAAIGKSQALIEFTLDGTIVTANEQILTVVGYTLGKIQGKHHSLFVEPCYRDSAQYRAFWAKLGRGEYDAGQYKRLGKGGKEVWIQVSYNPIFGAEGKPYKVVKVATDITAEKLRSADFEGQLAAIGKGQAVIEFDLDGTIRTANDNFLKTLGYSLELVRGKHHISITATPPPSIRRRARRWIGLIFWRPPLRPACHLCCAVAPSGEFDTVLCGGGLRRGARNPGRGGDGEKASIRNPLAGKA